MQPVQYLILPWAIILGYRFLSETLDAYTIAGALVVVGSGVYVAYREYKLQKTALTVRPTLSGGRDHLVDDLDVIA